jgi:hypothetical protein
MEGIAEAIGVIQGTAVKAHEARVLNGIQLRNAKLVHHDGQLVEHKEAIPARGHNACDLESFAAIVGDYGKKDEATVWHKDNTVVAVLDAGDASYRDDSVRWLLTASEKFKALTQDAPRPRAHAEFVRFLVQTLRDELDASAPGLLGTIRNLKFRSADEQTGDIKQGRESMGRSIEAEITGAAELPETVLVKVRRWASLDYVATVECLLVLDVQERKLSLRPLADQLEQAENGAQGWLHGQLSGAVECPVYFGTP